MEPEIPKELADEREDDEKRRRRRREKDPGDVDAVAETGTGSCNGPRRCNRGGPCDGPDCDCDLPGCDLPGCDCLLLVRLSALLGLAALLVPPRDGGLVAALIRLYRRHLTRFTPACPSTPSCSASALAAVEALGPRRGLAAAARRIRACGAVRTTGDGAQRPDPGAARRRCSFNAEGPGRRGDGRGPT